MIAFDRSSPLAPVIEPLTVEQMVQRHPALTPGGIRWMLFHREARGRHVQRESDNLVALLFALERSKSHEEIDRRVARLAEVLRGPDDLELRRAFTAFLRRSLLPSGFRAPESQPSKIWRR